MSPKRKSKYSVCDPRRCAHILQCPAHCLNRGPLLGGQFALNGDFTVAPASYVTRWNEEHLLSSHSNI